MSIIKIGKAENVYLVITADGIDIICDSNSEAMEHKQDLIESFCFESSEVAIVYCPASFQDDVEVYLLDREVKASDSAIGLARMVRKRIAVLIDEMLDDNIDLDTDFDGDVLDLV